MAQPGIMLAPALVGGLIALGACDGTLSPDLDGHARSAQPLELGAWHSDELLCRKGKGDCNDWYRVRVTQAGRLSIEVELTGGKDPAPHFTLALVDADEFTLMEVKSGGRKRAGLRSDVPDGAYLLWISPADYKDTRMPYELRATLDEQPERLPATPPPYPLTQSESRSTCLALRASPDLNFYDGQPHVVVLRIYPLSSTLGFGEMSVQDLLNEASPPGMAGSKLQVTVTPNEERLLRETIPREAGQLGLVADYYRAPGEPEGSRKLIVNAACGTQTPLLRLAPRDLLVER